MKIIVKITKKDGSEQNVSAKSLRSILMKLTGKEKTTERISAVVKYSKHKVKDTWGDTVEVKNELPETTDFKQFLDDLYQTANADELEFHLSYWDLED